MLNVFRNNLVDLPTNSGLYYYWCSGFMIANFLVLQVLSGVILSFLYSSNHLVSFNVVMNISNENILGWCLRYSHIWGVSFIFILFIFHMGRALYYSSYSKTSVWNVGFILYVLMMIEAFLGYILPWHQMSYWAATVLTSVVCSVPFFGEMLYSYIVGGFSVSYITLLRVFSAHVVVAFVILALSIIHLFYLHVLGSNNSLFLANSYTDFVYFNSSFTIKDLFCISCAFTIFFFYLWVDPDFFLDVESYLAADPMVTPASIKPEWYFLFYYAMLRSVSSKIGGLLLVIIFMFLFWLPSLNYACCYSIIRQWLFWGLIAFLVILSYLGACAPDYPFSEISQVSSFMLILGLFFFKFFWRIN